MTQTIKLTITLKQENMTATGPQGGVQTLSLIQENQVNLGLDDLISGLAIKLKWNNGGSWLTCEKMAAMQLHLHLRSKPDLKATAQSQWQLVSFIIQENWSRDWEALYQSGTTFHPEVLYKTQLGNLHCHRTI